MITTKDLINTFPVISIMYTLNVRNIHFKQIYVCSGDIRTVVKKSKNKISPSSEEGTIQIYQTLVNLINTTEC